MINQIISHQKSNLFLNFANIKGCTAQTHSVLQRNLRRVHTLLMASCSGRNLIGWRTESDRAADGNQRRCAAHRCTNKAVRATSKGGALVSSAPTEQAGIYSHRTRGTHRTVWQRKPPTDRHGYAQIRRVWHPAIPTPPITQPNHLWKSVKSVGEYYHAGAAASAASTKQTERVFPQNTRNTQNLLAEKCLPQIGTDTHSKFAEEYDAVA